MPSPKETGDAALGWPLDSWPLDEPAPLYSQLATVAADHPGQPLPNLNDWLLFGTKTPEPFGPFEAGADPSETRGDEWRAPRIARSLRWFFERSPRDREALRSLYPELLGADMWAAFAVERMLSPVWPREAVANLGRWLCRYAADGGPVRVGLMLLAKAGAAEDRELISTLALADGMFTSEAIRALEATQPDPDNAIFAVAQRLRSWGLFAAVAALKGTSDPRIKRWMVRDVSTWGLVYLCDTVAKTGDLLSALRDGPIDDKLLDNAGTILTHLCDPNVQTAGIDRYRDARAALAVHQRRLATNAGNVLRLDHLVTLEESVKDGVAAGLDWESGEREALLNGYADLLANPMWTNVVETALASRELWRYQHAERNAPRIGFDLTGAKFEPDGITTTDRDGRVRNADTA